MRHAPPLGRARARALSTPRRTSLKAALLAGVVVFSTPAPVLAAKAKLFTPATKGPPPDDGLGPRDTYMEADNLADDRATHIVTARGHVEARTQGRTVRADELVYNRDTGAAHAHGHVVLINADGTVQYAQDLDLDDKMRAGVAIGFATRLQQNVTIAAGAAIRRTETVQQLNNAIFTPCNICEPDGVTPKAPTWSIQASRIIQDHEHQIVYYRNAIIRVKNVPVFFFPFFSTPDPSAQRSSGFLTPRIDYNSRRGFSYEQPYYIAISPYNDLTISPQFNTRVNPLLNLRYRQRFYSGLLDIRTGVTYEQNFTKSVKFDNATPRSYVLGTGAFDIDKHWIWGFGLERVTDPTFFRRYSIREVFLDRGPFPTDTDRLISQLYTRRQDDTSFVSIAAMSFQSVRAYAQNVNTGAIFGESSRTFPVVAPLIEARYDPTAPVFGGRLRARFNAVSLNRDHAVTTLVDPSGLPLPAGPLENIGLLPSLAPNAQTLSYTDSRRATGQVDWRRAFTLGPGVRVEPFAQGRADAYFISGAKTGVGADFTTANAADAVKGGKDDFVGRLLGTVGADVSWPLYRSFGRTGVILEPIAQFAVSPTVRPSARIPNEDSVSFEFDETNLFSTNRFSGFDLYEGGARLNSGVRASAYFPNGGSGSLLVGRTFRTEPDPVFSAQSGLRGTSSDWLVTASTSPISGVYLFSRSRLDADTFAIRREEAGINATRGPVSGGVRYLYNESGLVVGPNGSSTVGRVENLDINGQIRFLKNWGVSANASRDLRLKVWPVAQLGVFYQDECIRVDVIYTHDEVFGRADASNSIGIRLTLATLGDTTPRRVNRGSR